MKESEISSDVAVIAVLMKYNPSSQTLYFRMFFHLGHKHRAHLMWFFLPALQNVSILQCLYYKQHLKHSQIILVLCRELPGSLVRKHRLWCLFQRVFFQGLASPFQDKGLILCLCYSALKTLIKTALHSHLPISSNLL